MKYFLTTVFIVFLGTFTGTYLGIQVGFPIIGGILGLIMAVLLIIAIAGVTLYLNTIEGLYRVFSRR